MKSISLSLMKDLLLNSYRVKIILGSLLVFQIMIISILLKMILRKFRLHVLQMTPDQSLSKKMNQSGKLQQMIQLILPSQRMRKMELGGLLGQLPLCCLSMLLFFLVLSFIYTDEGKGCEIKLFKQANMFMKVEFLKVEIY